MSECVSNLNGQTFAGKLIDHHQPFQLVATIHTTGGDSYPRGSRVRRGRDHHDHHLLNARIVDAVLTPGRQVNEVASLDRSRALGEMHDTLSLQHSIHFLRFMGSECDRAMRRHVQHRDTDVTRRRLGISRMHDANSR